MRCTRGSLALVVLSSRGAPICSVWSLALLLVTLLNLYAEQRDRSALFEWTRGIQFVLAMLSVLIYYDGSNVVNRYRFANRGEAMLYDPQLLAMDEALLGWLYPRGQLALYLDTQTTIGVTSLFGRIYAEMFQILYISYYFWGNAIGVWLAFQYFYYSVWRKNKDTKKRMQWRRIQMFVSAWVGGFVLNHLINLCFPAMSPRIFIAESFKNELKGVWMLEKLRGAVTGAAANTYSAFPSGHCGLSILAAILSFRIGLAKWYSYLVLLTTVLIVLATQVLRYHYFVDFLFSLTIVSFGAWLGGFHEKELYQRSLEVGVEEFDEDGKPMQSPGGRLESVPLLSLRTPIASSTSPDVELGQSRRESTDHDGGVLTLTTAMFGMTRSISSQAINKDKEQAYAAQQAEARAQ